MADSTWPPYKFLEFIFQYVPTTNIEKNKFGNYLCKNLMQFFRELPDRERYDD